jgi:hypothetical protein
MTVQISIDIRPIEWVSVSLDGHELERRHGPYIDAATAEAMAGRLAFARS